jgi:hypothetical protein
MDDDDDNNNGGSEGYEVGYGRPPKHSQFRKGQSGNPKGRRKGSRGLKTDLDEALRATLTITVGGKKRRGTTQALTMYALAIKSATGDLRASKQLADLVLTIFGPGDRTGAEARLSKQDEELLARLLERFDPETDRQSQGDDDPTPDQDGAGDPDADEKGDEDA